jgi:hypothetical protein
MLWSRRSYWAHLGDPLAKPHRDPTSIAAPIEDVAVACRDFQIGIPFPYHCHRPAFWYGYAGVLGCVDIPDVPYL